MRMFLGKRPSGFNLLEVVIAAFIFSAISISFVGVWGQQVRALEKSRHVMVATFLAEELIEETMSEGYERTKDSISAGGIEEEDIDMVTLTRNPSDPEQWDQTLVKYHYTREVRIAGDPEVDKLKQVIVTVTWKDTTKTGEIVLETYLAGAQ